jgi:hypothetical protein
MGTGKFLSTTAKPLTSSEWSLLIDPDGCAKTTLKAALIHYANAIGRSHV